MVGSICTLTLCLFAWVYLLFVMWVCLEIVVAVSGVLGYYWCFALLMLVLVGVFAVGFVCEFDYGFAVRGC